MKTFFLGILVASLGFSGVANILDFGLKAIHNHAQVLNYELEQVEN